MQLIDNIVLEDVSKLFRHRPALFNWIGKERAGDTWALKKICLRIPSGSVSAVLGPNGSGKTTLLKVIATMLLPDAGRVIVEGLDACRDAQAIRRRVGFALAAERSFFPRLTASENLVFFATLDNVSRQQRRARVQNVLATVHLTDAADTLVMKFSSGMYQRLGIARALLKRPSVLLLDEPTRSLDPQSAANVWSLVQSLRDHGTTIVLATHNFDEAASVADSVVILRDGELCAECSANANARQLKSFYQEWNSEPSLLETAS